MTAVLAWQCANPEQSLQIAASTTFLVSLVPSNRAGVEKRFSASARLAWVNPRVNLATALTLARALALVLGHPGLAVPGIGAASPHCQLHWLWDLWIPTLALGSSDGPILPLSCWSWLLVERS